MILNRCVNLNDSLMNVNKSLIIINEQTTFLSLSFLLCEDFGRLLGRLSQSNLKILLRCCFYSFCKAYCHLLSEAVVCSLTYTNR